MRLAEIMKEVPARVVAGPADIDIRAIADHSKRVEDGSLFAAIEGHRGSGAAYVREAIDRGACAVLSRSEPGTVPAGGAWIQADDERLALALMARNFHRRPDETLRTTGITGTNGKTTVSYLLQAILSGAGGVARLGTIDYAFGGATEAATRTTPSPVDLYRMLAAARDRGDRYAVLEVSSHALVQKRTAGMRFEAAVFTNLSRDHLDYHGDMDGYFAAKRILFDGLPPGASAVINRDDPHGARLAASLPGAVRTFGLDDEADCRPETWSADRDGIHARIRLPGGTVEIRSVLLGQVNLYNILAAVAAADVLGCDSGPIAAGIASVERIPGRLERIDAGQDFLVVVDYAHSPDALEKLLQTVRDLRPERILCVFGCGGDRDPGKRRPMGCIGATGSDIAILTSDNPRTEDPMAILAEIEKGARGVRGGARRIEVIADRRAAIGEAIRLARPGDAVVIAGKGHETVQELPTATIRFDDREVVRGWLGLRAESETTYGAA